MVFLVRVDEVSEENFFQRVCLSKEKNYSEKSIRFICEFDKYTTRPSSFIPAHPQALQLIKFIASPLFNFILANIAIFVFV
jgi:membrane-associated protease RseP (regulator of RpoE activity)